MWLTEHKVMLEIRELIEKVKGLGFKVIYPENLTTYFFYSDGKHIGYIQNDRLEGICISSHHKPSKGFGEGSRFKNFAELTKENLKNGMTFVIYDYKNEGQAPKFYNDLNEFVTNYWQKLIVE
jgi:hypothetical protein